MRTPVLYVDDEPYVLRAFERIVERAGFEVTTVGDPHVALELLEAASFDVVCSDYRMDLMSGLDFLAQVGQRAPKSARILITAFHDFAIAVDAFKVGVDRLVPKPWVPEMLVGVLEEAAEKVHLRRENERLQALLADNLRRMEGLNAALDVKLADRTDQVIGSLVTALDYRDEETMAHSRRVSLMSRRVAAQMGLRGQLLTDIEWGGMLHDVGKIGVPDAILLKRGKLTADEWTLMRRHVEIGHHMLQRIDFLQNAARVVADHHERWDGSGYPRGKRGEETYIGARIFAVADTFDAITSDRPYRPAGSDQEAFAELQRVSGQQLDPACVEAFLAVPSETWWAVRREAAQWAAERSATGAAGPLTHGAGLAAREAVLGED